MVGSVPSSRADAGGQLLRELEALSQALYKAKSSREQQQQNDGDKIKSSKQPLLTWHSQGFDKISSDLPDFLGLTPKDESAAAATQQIPVQQRKKKGGSLWDWKPLRALAHIGQTKFDCEFVAHVHGINKLPSALEGLRLQVRLKHKDCEARTVPSLVFKGSADFEEGLRIKCAVYGSSSSSGGIRYMSKTFTLSVVAPDASELELGKHRLDLSRILPDGSNATIGVKNSSWNTSFKLSGRAKGGILVITFGYELGKSSSSSSSSREDDEQLLVDRADRVDRAKFYYPQSPDVRGAAAALRSFNSLPSSPLAVISARKQQQQGSAAASPARSETEFLPIDIEHLDLDEEEDDDNATTMTMSASSGLLAPDTPGRQQEAELKGFSLEQSDEIRGDDDDEEDDEFSVIDQGVEEARKAIVVYDEEAAAAATGKRDLHPEADESLEVADDVLDDEAEMVAGEFLHMLVPSSDSEEGDSSSSAGYSPRGLLLKQFELEQQSMLMKSSGGFGMIMNSSSSGGGNLQAPEGGEDGGGGLMGIMDAAESELQKATQAMKSKARAKMLEDAEAEALMQEWGFDEKAFQSSPPKPVEWSGDPSTALIVLPEPPCLAEGLGSMIHTRDGGSLRTMNPIHFQGGRNDGRLVLQVSKPVVVPAEMGSGVLNIFQSLAAGGAENMAFQVMETMPLEDITGKNIYQIAMEGGQASFDQTSSTKFALGSGESGNRFALDYGGGGGGELVSGSSSGALQQRSSASAKSSARRRSSSSDDTFMSLEDLAPVAMEKIEALAMQGLKIQSDMAEEEAPYALDSSSFTSGKKLLQGGSSSMHLLEGGGGGGGEDEEGLMAMSISLDEWMRLDAGVYDDAETSGKTKAVLAAHHAVHSTDIVLLANDMDRRGEKRSGQACSSPAAAAASSATGGLMGDTLTLAMLVQLRDPQRNYEPVGAPMMAFVQAERVMIPPKPKMWKRVSIQGNSEGSLDEEEQQKVEQSQFKITGVHMAGLKTPEDGDSCSAGNKKKIWGTQKQQQSGSRWLLAHGMGKSGAAKHPLLKTSKNINNAGPPVAAAASAAANSGNSANSSSKQQGGESLWSISARMGSKTAAKVAATGSGITRNPDVKFGSRLSLGKKKW